MCVHRATARTGRTDHWDMARRTLNGPMMCVCLCVPAIRRLCAAMSQITVRRLRSAPHLLKNLAIRQLPLISQVVPSDARWASEKENKRGLNCEPRLELLTRASLTRVWNYTFTLHTKTFTLTQHIHYISIHPNIRLSPLSQTLR